MESYEAREKAYPRNHGELVMALRYVYVCIAIAYIHVHMHVYIYVHVRVRVECICVYTAMHESVPCPCCESSMKSHQWASLSGSLGDYIVSTDVSGVKRPQAEALCGMLRVCGLLRMRVVDPQQRTVKQETVIEVLVMCEARLPLYTCRFVRHQLLHFYELGGWACSVGPAPPLQK